MGNYSYLNNQVTTIGLRLGGGGVFARVIDCGLIEQLRQTDLPPAALPRD